MRHFIWLVLLFLSACHQQNIKVIDDSEVNPVQWSMKGKMAFSDGHEGGSGSVYWEQSQGLVYAEFKAPLGQGSWTLNEQEGWIKDNKGQHWQGDDMSVLLSQQLGWAVPWDALKQNIEGIKPKKVTSNQFEVAGWQVEWKKLKNIKGKMLPHKIFMKKPPYSVKIIIKSWSR